MDSKCSRRSCYWWTPQLNASVRTKQLIFTYGGFANIRNKKPNTKRL